MHWNVSLMALTTSSRLDNVYDIIIEKAKVGASWQGGQKTKELVSKSLFSNVAGESQGKPHH